MGAGGPAVVAGEGGGEFAGAMDGYDVVVLRAKDVHAAGEVAEGGDVVPTIEHDQADGEEAEIFLCDVFECGEGQGCELYPRSTFEHGFVNLSGSRYIPVLRLHRR